jgi:histidine triad (HIT) family protein
VREPGCIFCDIVAGDLPAHVVFEEETTMAFLDARPVFHGHCLLVPRDHYATLLDLPRGILETLFAGAQRLAGAVQAAMQAEGTFVAMNNIVSQSVPHCHVHVVPRRRKDGLRGFFWPRHRYDSDEEAASVAERIRNAAH